MDQDSSLPPVWIVGFTGHRRLKQPDKVAALLSELLHSLGHEISGQLVGHSSAAIGGDTLFAEACLSAGIPWVALLPLAEGDFKSDFSEADWNKARRLLQRAARVESLVGAKDRNVAYLECGLATVEEADLMIAVWDEEPSRGTGGTAEVVAHARNFGKPLVLVHPDRLTVQRERFSPEAFSDAEMQVLNSSGTSDEHGLRFRHGSRTACPTVLCQGGCASGAHRSAVSSLGGSFGDHECNRRHFDCGRHRLWHSFPFARRRHFHLIAAAMVSIIQIKRKHAHRNWIRCRVAAEICRSSLATWNLGHVAAPVWFTQLGDFRRLAKSIRLLGMRAGQSPLNLADCKREYLTTRVDDQIEYFRRRSRRLATALFIFTCSFWVFSAAAIARTVFATFAGIPTSDQVIADALQSFLPIALPLAAGCALSLISIFDLNRQLASSKAMEAALQTARRQIEKCESFSSLRRAVENTENAFAGEFFEWFTLFRFPRFN